MGNVNTVVGLLSERGVLPLLRSASRGEWSGAMRLRSGRSAAAVWLVKGQVVHALIKDGVLQEDGLPALEQIVNWHDGNYLLEPDALPPARSIRLEMPVVLQMVSQRSASQPVDDPEKTAVHEEAASELEGVLGRLRERVPGLESLSVSRGTLLAATTVRDEAERHWLSHQLETYLNENAECLEKLYVQQDNHTLLILRRGRMATVLSARNETAPEALFWAGEEVHRQMLLRG